MRSENIKGLRINVIAATTQDVVNPTCKKKCRDCAEAHVFVI